MPPVDSSNGDETLSVSLTRDNLTSEINYAETVDSSGSGNVEFGQLWKEVNELEPSTLIIEHAMLVQTLQDETQKQFESIRKNITSLEGKTKNL